MPYLRIDVVEGLNDAIKRELLVRSAALYAEILDSPIERVRTHVVEVPSSSFAVGGIPIAESGIQAPFIWVEMMAGRPRAQHDAVIAQISDLVAEIVGVPLERVRLKINEVPPEEWGIAGVPAASARHQEIEERRRENP